MDIFRCRFFPTGLVVLSGGMDMAVRVFSVESGNCSRTMKGHRGSIFDLGIIDRGIDVMSCSSDGTVKKWNCGRGEALHTWNPESGEVYSISLSSSMEIFAAGTRKEKAMLYDLRTSDEVNFFCACTKYFLPLKSTIWFSYRFNKLFRSINLIRTLNAERFFLQMIYATLEIAKEN